MSDDGRITYRYTADEQRSADDLRQKYALDPDDNHIEAARTIDRQVTRRATDLSIIIGLMGTLVMGAGLALVLSYRLMLPGVIIGCAGIAVMAAMPALYERILRAERRRAAPRVRAILDGAEKDPSPDDNDRREG